MKPPTTAIRAQEAEQPSLPSSSSPKPYPVSIRAYRKKDFEFLSSFPHSALRNTIRNADLFRARSDVESIASSMTMSSTTVTSTTASSVGSYNGQDGMMEAASSSHYLLSTERNSDHPRSVSMDVPLKPLHAEVADDEKHEKPSPAEVKADLIRVGNTDHEGRAPPEVDSPEQEKEKPQAKAVSTQRQPTALPRFGSWDTRNPASCREDYNTAIARKLREEKKKSGGAPPALHEEKAELGPIDGDNLFSPATKEPPAQSMAATTTVSWKSSSSSFEGRRYKKGSDHERSAHVKKSTTVWGFCCKSSAVDD